MKWLFPQLVKKLQYEEKKSPVWVDWVSDVSSDQVQAALDAGDELVEVLGQVLEEESDPVKDGLMKLGEWLSVFQRLIYKAPEPEPDADSAPGIEPEPENLPIEDPGNGRDQMPP